MALLGSLILAYDRHPIFIAAAIAAFLLVGPIITAGLCELSRCRDHGEISNFGVSLQALGRSRAALFTFAGILAVIAIAEFCLAALYLYSATGSFAPAVEATLWGDVLAQLSRAQIITYSLTFGLLSCVIFALSVVTVPMIIDRHVDAGTAMRMSIKVIRKDFSAMMVWAFLIVGLVLVGFVTKLIGMIVVLPLLGHATWYAYRDIVEEA